MTLRAQAATLVAALALSSPASAVEVSWVAIGRADLRVRSLLPGDRSTVLTTDLELLPSARLAFDWSQTRVELTYTPSLLFREPQLLGPVRLMNRGSAQLRHRWGQGAFTLLQQGAYGQADVGALRTREDITGGAVVEVQTLGLVNYVSSSSYATLELTTGRRSQLSLSGGYLLSGSPDSPALPIQRGPTARASLRVTIDRRDSLVTTGQATHADFSNGQQQTYAVLTEEWLRLLARPLSLSLSAGAAFTREVIPPGLPSMLLPGTFTEVLPVATATITWREPLTTPVTQLEASARLAPFADRFTGLIYERLEVRLSGRRLLPSDLALTSNLGAAWAVPLGRSPQAGDVIVYADAALGWAAKTWLTLVGSGRVLNAYQPRLGAQSNGLQWVVTASVMVQEQGSTVW